LKGIYEKPRAGKYEVPRFVVVEKLKESQKLASKEVSGVNECFSYFCILSNLHDLNRILLLVQLMSKVILFSYICISTESTSTIHSLQKEKLFPMVYPSIWLQY
jgi:hypothetical protein